MKHLNLLKSALFAAVVICSTALVSCGGSDSPISKSDVKDAVKDSYIMRDSVNTATVVTGYYEISRDQYEKLQQYINAKLITAKFEVKVEKKKEWTSYWYNEYTIKNVNHMFAKVELTEKGQKLEVTEEIPQYSKSYDDIYEKLKEVDEETPDYLTVSDEASAYYDKAMNIDTKKSSEETQAREDSIAEASVSNASYGEDAKDEYAKALQLTDRIQHNMLLCKVKVDEIYDIVCTPEMAEKGIAEAKVVLKLKDKTPVFYISHVSSPKRFSAKVQLKKYVDKGWVVTDIDGI